VSRLKVVAVPASVDLDDDSAPETYEIEIIAAEGRLPTEVKTCRA
jgi:hypothetical protein